MSYDDFFGRPITPSTEDLKFDICEVCQRRSAQWLEVQYQENLPVVRFTCGECHTSYLEQKGEQPSDLTRQINDDENIEEAVRPGWVDEFISKNDSSGSISIIGTPEEAQTEGGPAFSEAPSSFQEVENREDQPSEQQKQIAAWAPKFIQEALFGPNPEGWLEDNGGYANEVLDLTVTTLGSFANHDVSSVKLSAIQCLQGVHRRNSESRNQVIEQLERYADDEDEMVSDFAKQIIGQIQ